MKGSKIWLSAGHLIHGLGLRRKGNMEFVPWDDACASVESD